MIWVIHGLVQFTVLAVVGFFVLAFASRCNGLLNLWGKLLGTWITALALLALVAGVLAPLMGWHVPGIGDHGYWTGHWRHPHRERPVGPKEGSAPPKTVPAPAPLTPTEQPPTADSTPGGG